MFWSGDVFKVKPTGFYDEINVRCEREKKDKNDSKVFVLSKWKDGVAPN